MDEGAFQALVHLNDQPMGPITPYARLRTQAEALNVLKVGKTKDTAIVLMFAMDQIFILK